MQPAVGKVFRRTRCMPCWVVPVVAAELWGVGVDHVLRAIADGTVPSKQEYGFTVVDVAPGSQALPQRRHEGPPPPTFVLVDDLTPIPPPEETPVLPSPVDQEESGELPPLDDEEDDVPISNWREVRLRVALKRQPPKRVAPRAA
jgi:hypothetical protein